MAHAGQALSWERRGARLEVRLHREPLNEIGRESLEELERLVAVIRGGALGARAVVIHSDRKGFCAGADLRELHAGLRARRARWGERLGGRLGRRLVRWEIGRFLDRIHRVFDALDTAPLTTVAAVHGPVFGGGFELALCCDLIVAERTARFAFPELRLGLIPGFGGVPRLRRDVGEAVVRDLLLSGRSLNARRAHALGLVSQVVPAGRGLEVARKVADQAARYDPVAVAEAKAFAKRIPRAELRREREVFARLLTRPAVYEALCRFVASTDVRPYV